jgi:DNA repair exonuclease SbcCD ATPase subunit
MADQDVTFDEVAGAAASLQKDGKPVTVDAVREILDGGSASIVYRHLALWRANNVKPSAAPKAELPKPLLADLAKWAIAYAEEAGAGSRANLEQAENDLEALRESGEQLEAELDDLQARLDALTAERDDALATLADRDETIERMQAELRNAKQVAMDALVGKAKDQLAIEGKDSQIAALRAQLEKNVAAQAGESDARLNAEMELIGATVARDSLAGEVKELRDQIAALRKR